MQTFLKKKTLMTVAAIVVTTACITAFTSHKPPQQHDHNFKVLPQNISHDSLDMIMDRFKMALGVKCSFCHAQSKTNPGRLDMSSDDKPEKEIARKMMVMTNDINQKYMRFNEDSTNLTEAVTCITCHRGDPHPEAKYPEGGPGGPGTGGNPPPPPPNHPQGGAGK